MYYQYCIFFAVFAVTMRFLSSPVVNNYGLCVYGNYLVYVVTMVTMVSIPREKV